MAELFYTGIGSRATPAPVRTLMAGIAGSLERHGFTLRSGGAGGADEAFESGLKHPEAACIYLPWKGFNDHKSPLYLQNLEERNNLCVRNARRLAEKYHPVWHKLSQGAQKLHTRNVLQILGHDRDGPVLSQFVICWTADGRDSGGTGQAIRIARGFEVPVYNLWLEDDRIKLYSQLNWDGAPATK